MAERRRPGARPLSAASLEKAALHYLERFASSAANLRRVLQRRVRRAADRDSADAANEAALIEAVIERLQRAGYLDDARYAEAKAASLNRRGASRRMIAGRLAQHGVEGELIAAALGEVEAATGDADLAAACALARRRRLGPYRPPEKRAAHRDKDLAAFARAGFSLDLARRVLACRNPEAVEALVSDQ